MRSKWFEDTDLGKCNFFWSSSVPMCVSAWAAFKTQVKELHISYLSKSLCQTLHHLPQLHYPIGSLGTWRNLIPCPTLPYTFWCQGVYICKFSCPDDCKLFLSFHSLSMFYSSRKGKSLPPQQAFILLPLT